MGTKYDGNAFVQLAAQGDAAAVKQALADGMDPNVKDDNGNAALVEAAKSGGYALPAVNIVGSQIV